MNYLLMMSYKPQEVQIFSRVSNLPLVNSALIIANDIYGRIKNYNSLVNATLSTTELSISYVATATPVTQVTKKLEKQISYADTMACNGLDKLEEKVPVIKKSPKEIKGEAVERIIELKTYGIKKMTVIKQVSIERTYLLLETPFIKLLREKLALYIGLVEDALDGYLPPIEQQNKTDLQSKELLSRVASIPSKVQHRLQNRYNRFLVQIWWKK